MDIIKNLLDKILVSKGDIIHVSDQEAHELYELLQKYHRIKLPTFDFWKETIFFFGWKLRIE